MSLWELAKALEDRRKYGFLRRMRRLAFQIPSDGNRFNLRIPSPRCCSAMSSSHNHEHHHHGDTGGQGDHGHGHDHDHDIPLGSGPIDSLFSQIDLPNVTAMNAEGGADAGQRVIKWAPTSTLVNGVLSR